VEASASRDEPEGRDHVLANSGLEREAPMTWSSEVSPLRGFAARIRGQVKGVSVAEVAWIVANKTLEVALTFACLKVLTRCLGPERFGEYNLALTVNVLLAAVTVVPVQQAYLRYFYQAKERNETWQVTRQVLTWYAWITIAIVVTSFLVSRPIGQLLSIEQGTCLAASLAFFGDRWRLLGIQVLNIQRRRSAWAVQHVSFLVAQLAFLALALRFWSTSVSAALLAYAGASIALASVSVASMRTLRGDSPGTPAGSASGLPSTVLSFGVPYGLLVVLQWVQGFSDRYLVGALLDLEAVGVYVAAYQICGVPFTLGSGIIHTLVVPVAYERAKGGEDTATVRGAQGVLLFGVGVYLVGGIAAVACLAVFGGDLLALLTDTRFALPGGILFLLAVGRYLEGLSVLLQVFFEIRQRMRDVFLLRFGAAIAMVVLCFGFIRSFGVLGAALGNLIVLAGYVVGMRAGMRLGVTQPAQMPVAVRVQGRIRVEV
jgi:O-antigen/teichoic acid export membrane protein